MYKEQQVKYDRRGARKGTPNILFSSYRTRIISTQAQRGGRFSRHIGHCNLYLIQPSKHGLWKICRHGVTIYARLLNSVVASEELASPSPPPAETTGTSMFCIQIAQSKVRWPLSFASLEPRGEPTSAVACVNPMGIVAPASSSSSRSIGW